jgi:predicted metal-dependent phosphoesterase TrpH
MRPVFLIMRKRLVDLHCHTTASDGVLSATQLIEKADHEGVTTLAIADHDSVSSIEEGLAAGRKKGMEIIPAIELSTIHEQKELHLLGYYIDYKEPRFLKKLAHFATVRSRRAKAMVSILSAEGFTITMAMVENLASGAIGKPHIAQAIIDCEANATLLHHVFGNIPTVSGFIEHYMTGDKKANVPKERLLFVNGIKEIEGVAGVPVLAHPGYDLPRDEKTRALIRDFKKQGLKGLEVHYFVRSEAETAACVDFFGAIAKKEGLIMTGGSDFHGEGKAIGAPLGLKGTTLCVPEESFLQLKKAQRKS